MTYLAYRRFLNLIRAYGGFCRTVNPCDDSDISAEVADLIFEQIDENLLSYVPLDEFPKDFDD